MATIETLPNGEFDVQDSNGKSVMGPFRSRETAEAAQRMLNMFDAVDDQIATINRPLRGLLTTAPNQ